MGDNFAQEIEHCAGETIRGIVISASKSGYSWHEEENNPDAKFTLVQRHRKAVKV